MYDLTQVALQAILCVSFALFGVMLILGLVVTKVTFFFLNTFAKKKLQLEKKPLILDKKTFFIPLIGTSFIITLTIAANNIFIYAISILIVATLITELEFLEKLMALIWGRDKYWEYRRDVDTPKVTEQAGAPAPSDTKALEKTAQKQEQNQSSSSTNQSTQDQQYWILLYHCEKVYRLIFGTQINVVQMLKTQENTGIPISILRYMYRSYPTAVVYPFESYMNFLVEQGLAQFDTATNTYHIAPIGRFFLDYIDRNNMPRNKPN